MPQVAGANVLGSFPVYNQTRNPIDLYGQILAKQEQKRLAEQKALQDELERVKPDGIRQADIDGYTQNFNDWRSTFNKMNAERDQGKKIALRSEFDNQEQKLLNFVNDSKTLNKGEEEFGKLLMNPNIRERYGDDVVTQYQKSKTLSKDHPDYIRDFTHFEIQPDLTKFNANLDRIDNTLLNDAKWNDPIQTPTTQGNRKGVLVEQSRAVAPQSQALAYAHLYDIDNEFKAGLRKMYGDRPKEELIQLAVADRPKQEFKPQEFKEDYRKPIDNFYAHWDYQLKNPKPTQAGTPTYRQDLLNRFIDDPNGIKDEFFDNIKSGVLQNPQIAGFLGNASMVKDKSGNISITVPKLYGREVDEDGNRKLIRQQETFTYNPDKREDAARVLNNLQNTYSTEKLPLSSTLTPGGKKKVPGGQGEQQFKSNGYTNQQAGIDAKGNEITIGVKNGKWYDVKTGKEFK